MMSGCRNLGSLPFSIRPGRIDPAKLLSCPFVFAFFQNSLQAEKKIFFFQFSLIYFVIRLIIIFTLKMCFLAMEAGYAGNNKKKPKNSLIEQRMFYSMKKVNE